MSYPATTEQVAWAFLERQANHLPDVSGQIGDTDSWIQTELPVLTLDLDYEVAWLIVVHDRTTDTWPWFVIATRFGARVIEGELQAWTHDAVMLNTDTFDSEAATAEGLPKMFALLEALRDADHRGSSS
jgi:hypothetical protein